MLTKHATKCGVVNCKARAETWTPRTVLMAGKKQRVIVATCDACLKGARG